MADKAVQTRMRTSLAGNKGFTLIELLIVLLIIGVATSLATLSLRTMNSSPSERLISDLEAQFKWAQQHSQLMNQPTQIVVQGTSTKVQRWQTQHLAWANIDDAPKVNFAGLSVQSEQSTIQIQPNGYVSPANWTIKEGNSVNNWIPYHD